MSQGKGASGDEKLGVGQGRRPDGAKPIRSLPSAPTPVQQDDELARRLPVRGRTDGPLAGHGSAISGEACSVQRRPIMIGGECGSSRAADEAGSASSMPRGSDPADARRAASRRSSPASRRARPATCISATPIRRCSPGAGARGSGGRFLLRIEDIDRDPLPARIRPRRSSRISPGSASTGTARCGAQSEHLADLPRGARRLDASAAASIPASAPAREIQAEIAAAGGAPHGPDGAALSRHLPAARPRRSGRARIAAGEPFALRLDVGAGARPSPAPLDLDRRARRRGRRPSRRCYGDVVLARKDVPTSYHLAVTVDDALQGVTLVTRGEDLFAGHPCPSAAAGAARPADAALLPPQPDHRRAGQRLAKRNRAVTIRHAARARLDARPRLAGDRAGPAGDGGGRLRP